MKLFVVTLPALLAGVATAAPSKHVEKTALPTIWLAGDSTMARGGAGGETGTDGWGPYFPYYLKNANVVNKAMGGRSARLYTDEGRFKALVDLVQPGHYVIIEFGHNDGGSLKQQDNHRTDAPGSGNETYKTAANVIVQTYVTYLTNAAKSLIAKGAKVIISSPTPNNICEGTTCTYIPTRFTEYCRQVVKNAGSGASFIDHGLYVANEYKRLGKAKVDTFYPVDHTHTSPAGAAAVAQTFVKAVLCENGVLAPYIKYTTGSIPGNCA